MLAASYDLHRFERRRVTALVGSYGSGKTELVLGLAAAARQSDKPTLIADLDVLKPYFRSREAGQRLAALGVTMLAPEGALANADLPIIPHQVRSAIGREDLQVFLDVGGDPVGARVLGSLSDVLGRASCDLFLVVNRYRPFSDTFERALEQARFIANAAQLPITGVISNTHLLDETTADDIDYGLDVARPLATALGVAVRLLGVPASLLPHFAKRDDLPPLVAIHRQMLPEFLGGVVCTPGGTA